MLHDHFYWYTHKYNGRVKQIKECYDNPLFVMVTITNIQYYRFFENTNYNADSYFIWRIIAIEGEFH